MEIEDERTNRGNKADAWRFRGALANRARPRVSLEGGGYRPDLVRLPLPCIA